MEGVFLGYIGNFAVSLARFQNFRSEVKGLQWKSVTGDDAVEGSQRIIKKRTDATLYLSVFGVVRYSQCQRQLRGTILLLFLYFFIFCYMFGTLDI